MPLSTYILEDSLVGNSRSFIGHFTEITAKPVGESVILGKGFDRFKQVVVSAQVYNFITCFIPVSGIITINVIKSHKKSDNKYTWLAN